MRHFLTAGLLVALLSGASIHAQTQTRQQAQAEGAQLGDASQGGGKLAPSALVTEGAKPGADNAWGGSFTGQANPAQTDKVTSQSMVGIGNGARADAAANFNGYNANRNDQASQATYFLDRNPILKPIISPSDPLLRTDNVKSIDLFPSETSTQCRQEEVNTPHDPNELYKCLQSYRPYEVSCSRKADFVCSGGGDGCDSGGIVPGSWAGDMSTSFSNGGNGNYILNFGTFADNYWNGYATVYDRTLRFDINGLNKISRFALTKASFDDWILVQLNGTVIYVGPYGGDRLSVYQSPTVFEPSSSRVCIENWDEMGRYTYCYSKSGDQSATRYYASCTAVSGGWNCKQESSNDGRIQYCETCFGNPELKTNWANNLNVDMKPFLREGSNTLFMRTIVSGAGEGAIQMTTRQVCPPTCVTNWTDNCGALRGLAQ